jgi:hypothetical protein
MMDMGRFRDQVLRVFLASSLLATGGIIPAYAMTPQTIDMEKAQSTVNMQNAKVTKEQAIRIAEEAWDIPEGFTQRNVEFQSRWWGSNTPAWIIYWEKQTVNQYGHMQIAVDADTGGILNIELYEPRNGSQTSYPPKIDHAEAKKLALEYIKANFPDKADQIVYDDRFEQQFRPPLHANAEYPIFFKRLVNGVMFEGNEIRITVDGNGNILGLGYRWQDDLKFPEVALGVTEEQAHGMIVDHLNLSLRFLRQWGPQQNKDMKYGYMPQYFQYYQPMYIQAMDGAFLSAWGDELDLEKLKLIPVSDKKLGSLHTGTPLTDEQALAELKKYFPIPNDSSLIRSSYNEQWGGGSSSVWEFNWQIQKEGEMNAWSHAVIDAESARVLTYGHDKQVFTEPGKNNSDPAITKEEAEKKAIELLRKLHPDIAHQIFRQRVPKMPHEKQYQHGYNFQFVRQLGNLSLEHGGINVTINAMTGEVSNYWFDVENMELPDKTPSIVEKEKAVDTYLDMIDIRLSYIVPEPKGLGVEDQNGEIKPILVYQARLKEQGVPMYLDAQTGQWTNRETGRTISSQTVNITDIKGHPAEKELNLLLKYNILDIKNDKIMPDAEITRGEMIKMLVLVENNGHPIWYNPEKQPTFKDVSKESIHFSYVENAVERNLLDPNQDTLNPDEVVDREELAQLIVKALGYDSLAKITDMFKVDLQDAFSIQDIGSAVIVTKLNILETRDGQFHPDSKVTRAEAAVAFYRYLEKRPKLKPSQKY